MIKAVGIFICVALLVSFVYSHAGHDHDHDHDHEEVDPNSNVLVLTDADFDQHLEANDFLFVEFYAPWCGHCKRLAPDYEIVATALKNEGGKVAVAKVDATQNPAVSGKYGIRGYPTLKFFIKGREGALDYEGGRSSTEMINWLKKKSGPASLSISTQAEYDSFYQEKTPKVIAFINEQNSDLWKTIAGSKALEDFAIAHVSDSSLFGSYQPDSVVIFKLDEEPVVHSGPFSEEEVLNFVLSEGFPLVEELAQKAWVRSQGSQIPILAYFHEEGDEKATSLIKDLARKFKGKLISAASPQKDLAERWGTSGKKFPTAIFVKWEGTEPKMTIFDEDANDFTLEHGEDFINKAFEGTYKGYRKSEPIPEKNDAPVKIIVGKNFDDIVLDKSKDVFVEFYAPWCGHCKKLAPVWDELGESFEGVNTVVIGKMDATANTAPSELDIRGFPTLIFFPADKKEGVAYEGDRDLNSLKQFVKEHASHSIKEEL